MSNVFTFITIIINKIDYYLFNQVFFHNNILNLQIKKDYTNICIIFYLILIVYSWLRLST